MRCKKHGEFQDPRPQTAKIPNGHLPTCPVPFVPPPIPPTVPADEPDPEPIPPPPVQQAVPTQLTLKKAVALPTAVRADVRSIAVAAPLRKDRLGW